MNDLLIARTGSAFVLMVAFAAGCASSSTQVKVPVSVQGRYAVTVTRTASLCAPQQLPSPIADTAQYVQVPTQGSSAQIVFQVVVTDSMISVVPTSSDGTALSALALSGLYSPVEPVVLRLTSNKTEGLRADGRAYFVTESNADTAQFSQPVETPPGNRAESYFSSHGSVTIVFREGGPSGTVYTTCVYSETLSGARIAQ